MNPKLSKAYAERMSADLGRKVSAHEAETEIVRIIQTVARAIAPQFRFGYHSVEDIEQEGIMEALDVLEGDKYDPSRPLGNFLYTHMHNRLYNFRRKHYQRLEAPCKCCDPFDPPAYPCQKWEDWSARNAAKQNLMRPLDMANISDEGEALMRDESSTQEDAVATELRGVLDRELPVELRKDYLQMLDGQTVPKSRREKVREAVLAIMKERGFTHALEESAEGGD